MKIDSNLPPKAANPQPVGEKLQAHQNRAARPAAAESGDSLTLSPATRLVQGLANEAASLPDVRQELVEKVAAQIANGTYQIDSQAVAAKLLAALRGEET